MRVHRLVSVVAIALAVAACQLGPTAPSPSAAVVAPSVVEAPPTQDELEAIAFRTQFGLRADLEHVREVAIDPSANLAFGVPLLPAEANELAARSSNAEAILGFVRAEAARAPADYCGVYLDNLNAGAVTSMWRANLVLHELAIRSQINPNARVAFVDCRFSEVQLNQVMEALNAADHGWMLAIPAQATGWGTNTMLNRIEMDISSAVPDAADRVVRHYTDLLALPSGIFAVTSDGTGAELVPSGTINVYVTKPNGKPLGSNNLDLSWSSGVPGLGCGGGDVGYPAPSGDKPTKLPCQVGTWTVRVVSGDEVFGEGQATVRAGKTVDLHITLTRNPPAN